MIPQFPQSPVVDPGTGEASLEWFLWFQNPQVQSLIVGDGLSVDSGGTGLTSGTSGGVLAFTAADTIASSGLLSANRIVLGGGAGGTPTTPVALGASTQVLHGNATGAPSFGSVVLTTDVTGVLPPTSGGTGIANASASTLTISGAFATTLTVSGATGITLPTTGTLATLAGSEALTNKTYNGNTFTAGTGVLTIAAVKTLTVSNTLTLAGTDATVLTFPGTSATIARIDAAQTFAGVQTFGGTIVQTDTTDATTPTSGATKTAGGLGVAKALWVGGLANIAGATTFGARANAASYTVATLPAVGAAGGVVYVSDAAVAPCIAFSNGTNWKRCDNAATTVI